MAAQTITNGRVAMRRTNLLRYIVNRFASSAAPSASLVHDDIFAETGIKDRRTWLKHLHGLEADRLLEVCYGKNQYMPTVVRPGEMLWHFHSGGQGDGDRGRAEHLPDADAVACFRDVPGVMSQKHCRTAPVTTPSLSSRKKAVQYFAMAPPDKNAMASDSAMSFSAASDVPWHENAMALSLRPGASSKPIFDKIVYFSDLGNGVYIKKYYNLQETSKDSKIINLKVRSVLSSTDSGRLSEKSTHTQLCATQTKDGRRKEREGGGQLTAADGKQQSQRQQTGMVRTYSAARDTISTTPDADEWYRWAVETAHIIDADEAEFVGFASKWLERSVLNGKFTTYKTHSIKDFIIQDYNREKQEKQKEAAMRGAIIGEAAGMAARPLPPVNVPKGVKLDGWYSSRKDKIIALRAVAETYRYNIVKVLRGEDIGYSDLTELHNLFLLNIPYYAKRWNAADDKIKQYEAAKKWIVFCAQRGCTPQNILQQVGF